MTNLLDWLHRKMTDPMLQLNTGMMAREHDMIVRMHTLLSHLGRDDLITLVDTLTLPRESQHLTLIPILEGLLARIRDLEERIEVDEEREHSLPHDQLGGLP